MVAIFPYLHVTTPHMKNARVKVAQKLLKHNRWGIDFMPHSPVDGEYGELTAAAVRHAKYLLGYRKALIGGGFGPGFYGYLIPRSQKGSKLRTPAMVVRAKKRARKEAAKHTVGKTALKLAISQIGTKESPYGSNRVKYSVWYNLIGPWCAMFESWCFAHSGHPRFHYAAVSSIYYDAGSGRNGLSITGHPEPGDICCYTFSSSDPLSHTGFFERWITQGESFYAVEGNTSGTGSQSNGGEVCRKVRYVSQVARYVRVHG